MCLHVFIGHIRKVVPAAFVIIEIWVFGVGQIVSSSTANFSKLRHTILMWLPML